MFCCLCIEMKLIFLCIDFVSCNFTEFIDWFYSFLVELLGFSMYKIVSATLTGVAQLVGCCPTK